MNTFSLHRALEIASQAQLADVIDWIRRPWAPGRNDSLRGAWHELRKRGSNRMQLIAALEHEIRSLDLDLRDREYVAQRVGAEPRGQAIVEAIERRLRHAGAPPARGGDVLEQAVHAAAALVTQVLEQAAHGSQRSSRGRRHGR